MSDNELVILLAEDSEDDAFFFQRAFKKACVDCQLRRAENGKVAIDILEKALHSAQMPFLIFLDLKMPVMSGFDVLDWLNSLNRGFQPKIVVLSGSNDGADRARALHLGATEYLVKPIVPEEIARLVRAFIPSRLAAVGMGERA